MAASDHGLSWNPNISVTWQVNIIPVEKIIFFYRCPLEILLAAEFFSSRDLLEVDFKYTSARPPFC